MTGKSDKSIVLSKRFLAVLLLALGPLFVLQYHRNVQIEIQFQVLQNSVNGIETKLSDLEYLLRGLDEKLSYRDEDKPAGRLLENGVYDIPDHAPHSRYLYNLETLKEDSRIPVNVDREFSYDDFKPIFEVDPLHQIVFTPKVLELIDDHNATTDEYYADYADDIEMYQKKFHDLLDAESLEERDREYMTVKWVSVFEGFGVFAKKDIKEGDLIGRYTGEVKLDNPNTDYTWTYMTTEINGEYVDLGVDGENRGNYLRFINHKGEDRNCEAEYVIHKNRWMTIYVAARDIEAGEELTTNYGGNYFESRISSDKEARISATNAKFKDFKVGLRQFEPALDRSRDNRYENQGNNLNVPKMHFEVKETYIESPQYAEAITLPRQPDLAYSNNGSNYSVSSQHHRTVNEAYIPEPVMQQGITIPRPVKKYNLPPIDPKDLPPVPNNKPQAQRSFKSVETKESLLSNDKTSNSARRQDVGKSIMMFLEDNKKNCMYGCIPVNKRKRTICLSVTGAFLLIFGIVMFLYFPRMPDFEVLDIKVPPGNSFTLTPVNLASEDLDFQFTLQMNMNISVINSNRYQMTIQTLKVSAFIMANISELNSQTPSSAERLFGKVVANRLKVDESNNKQLIGRGSRNTPLVFLPGKPFLFSMDFLVAYSPNKKFGSAVNDPALNEIIQLCVEAPLRPDFNRTSTIRYEAEAEISGLPFKPLLSGELKINCPFQGSARQKLLAAIKGQSSSGIESKVPVDDAPPPAGQPSQVSRARMTTKNIIFSEAVLPTDFIVKTT